MGTTANLIIASSEGDSNMLYATRFFVPDPFIFFEVNGTKTVVMSDLEVDRARSQAKADEVLSLSQLTERLKKKGLKNPSSIDILHDLFKRRGVRQIFVPANFPTEYADRIRAKGYDLKVRSDPFFHSRMIKTPEEIREITDTYRRTEKALDKAIQTIRQSKIKGSRLYSNGKPLTSEQIKKIINVTLMELGCVATHTIVACGEQGVDPHNEGSGPLYAHQSIIMDVFPHSTKTHYYADITRTVVRGKASPKLKKMFEAVREGQEIAFRRIRDGADGSKIHRAILDHFEKLGFKTGQLKGRMQGFFHGTGHGLGLDVHEPPRISGRPDILRAGMVVTVEPGLYYSGVGGIRLEDLVLVKQNGMTNLARYPKFLEI